MTMPSTAKQPELPFVFGEGFLQDHAGHILSEPHIALIELIANAYDAGASPRRDVDWPSRTLAHGRF